ncbi:MAG: hypothetical protein HC873_06175 [Leptolyngbyaceae cyanobacterium SL_1_1]|nr:hypothetical protein [Leptolyngbyaceae cyanobacterium SL_1_1]
MTQNQRHDSAYADLNLFPSETSKIPKATAETSSIPERLTRLIWRYPFGLLAGIWLVSVLIALLAFGGLTDPGADPAPQAAEPSPLRSQSSSPESIPQPSSTTAALPRAESSSAIAEISQSSTAEFPGWSLLLLVGACAGGCFVLSRCLQQPATASTPEANRRSSRRPIAAKVRFRLGLSVSGPLNLSWLSLQTKRHCQRLSLHLLPPVQLALRPGQPLLP